MRIYKRGNKYGVDARCNGVGRRYIVGSRRDAEKELRKVMAQHVSAKFNLAPDNYPLKQLKTEFLEEVQTRVAPKTFHDYCVLLETIFTFIGNTSLLALRDRINQFINSRQAEGRAPRTINHAIEILNRMLNFGVQTNRIPHNPLAGLPRLKVRDNSRRPMTEDEIEALLRVSGPYRIIWLCFILTGLRRAELTVLRWSDVDLKKGIISIKTSKTDAGIRKVPIASRLQKELQTLRQQSDGEFVFTTERGTPFKHNLLKRFKMCLRKAGINQDELNLHCLRYTFASRLASKGVNPKLIQELMGHRTVLTSLNIYAKVFTEDLAKAVRKIDF